LLNEDQNKFGRDELTQEQSHDSALEGKDMAGQPTEDGIGASVIRLEVWVLGKELVESPRLTHVAIDE
jgi:hypothetical protein